MSGGIEVHHVTGYRWVQWFVDETYVKVNAVWRYVYRAVDRHGQVIEVVVSRRRDIASARRFFTASLLARAAPAEVSPDRVLALANVIEDLIPAAFHATAQYENNRCGCDQGRLKARLRPMRGWKTDRTSSVVIRGHAFVQNVRRGHNERGVETAPVFLLATEFEELQLAK
jgi:IS6 family transposase